MELLTEPAACLRRGSDRRPLWSIPDSTCESFGRKRSAFDILGAASSQSA